MNKRQLAWSSVILAISLALVLAFPRTRFWLHGRLRGEAFYQGRPTSYWISALNKEPFLGSPPRDVGKALAGGGRAAVPVLAEMLRQSDHRVHQQALLTLTVIGSEAEEARPALEEFLGTEADRTCLDMAMRLLVRMERRAAVDAVVQALERNPSAQGRAWAARSLGGLGPEAHGGLPALEQALRDDDQNVQVSAASAIWQLEHRSGPILPVLIDVIKSGHEEGVRAAVAGARQSWTAGTPPIAMPDDVTAAAIRLLLDMGSESKEAVPLLLEASKDGRPAVRRRVALVLGLIGRGVRKAVPGLVEALQQGGEDTRVRAAVALGRSASRGAVEPLIAALGDPSAPVRREAVTALGELRAREAVPALLAAVHDDSRPVVVAALAALGKIGAREAVPTLVEAVKNDEESVRVAAILALGDLKAPEGVPALILALRERPTRMGGEGQDSLMRTRVVAVSALEQMGPPARQAVPALLEVIGDAQLGSSAIRALGAIGPDAQSAVPPLMELLETKVSEHANWQDRQQGRPNGDQGLARNSDQQKSAIGTSIPASNVPLAGRELSPRAAPEMHDLWSALRTLGDIGPGAADALPRIIPLLKDNALALDVAQAIGRIGGPRARPAVAGLREMLKQPEASFRVAAALALWQIDRSTRESMPVLMGVLNDPNATCRVEAAQAIWEITGRAELVLPVLQAILTARDQYQLAPAIQLVGWIGPPARSLAPELVQVLGYKPPFVRQQAAQALARMGPEARAIGPRLLEALDDQDDPQSRRLVADALKAIDARAAARAGVQ
jgi:HEAT repeat protein